MSSPHDHRADLIVLGLISLGVLILCGLAIWRNSAAEASAWTAVLMAIINSIKERWTQHSLDRMGAHVAASQPTGTVPPDAVAAAEATANAAERKAEEIAAKAP